MSVIETVIYHVKTESSRVYFFLFCTKYVTCFSKYRIGCIVGLFSTNDTKIFFNDTVHVFGNFFFKYIES